MKHLLLFSLIATLSAGCASAPKTSKVDVAAEVKRYTQKSTAVTADEASRGVCPKSVGEREGWKALASAANNCVKAKEWAKVEEYGSLLSSRDYYSPWGPYYLSLAAAERGDAWRADWMLGLALKKAPTVGLFYYQQARLQYQRQNYPAAVESFTKAIELDPALTDAHLALGQLYYRDQQWDEAIPHLKAVISRDAGHQLALASLGEAYLHKNDTKNALLSYESASSHYPDNLDYRLKMAYIHEKLNNDPAQALSVYRQISFLMETRRIRTDNPGLIRERIKILESSLAKAQKSVAQSDRGLASQAGEKK